MTNEFGVDWEKMRHSVYERKMSRIDNGNVCELCEGGHHIHPLQAERGDCKINDVEHKLGQCTCGMGGMYYDRHSQKFEPLFEGGEQTKQIDGQFDLNPFSIPLSQETISIQNARTH